MSSAANEPQWKVGVIGYGWAASTHIAAINEIPGAQVRAVCSRRELDQGALSAIHGNSITVTHTVDDLLSLPEINVISVCSPSGLHAAHAIAAAAAGKHLIIEKPLALTVEDCVAVAKAINEAGVRACVCLEVRHTPQFTTTRSIIDQGLIGAVHYGEVDYFQGIGPSFSQYSWNITRAGGGSSLLTAGCHALDGLLLFLNTDVEEVFSYSTKSEHPDFAPYEYETSSVTVLRFANGSIGKVASVIDAHQPYYLRVHLVGSHGTILDNRWWTTRIEGLDPEEWSTLGVDRMSSAEVAHQPYRLQFQAFFEALKARQEMPLTGLTDALRTFGVVFAADYSAASKRPVNVSMFLKDVGWPGSP